MSAKSSSEAMTGKPPIFNRESTGIHEMCRGGAIVYRIALWYPDFVTHLFSVCTPYWAPSKEYVPLEKLVHSGRLPNFAYQLQLASGVVEEKINSRDQIRQFLNALYGGLSSKREKAFDARHGLHSDVLPRLLPTKLVDGATLDYYADQYAKNGMHGPRKSPLLYATSTS